MGVEISSMTASVSASRITEAAQAGRARHNATATTSTRSQPVKIPSFRSIYRVHSLTGRRPAATNWTERGRPRNPSLGWKIR